MATVKSVIHYRSGTETSTSYQEYIGLYDGGQIHSEQQERVYEIVIGSTGAKKLSMTIQTTSLGGANTPQTRCVVNTDPACYTTKALEDGEKCTVDTTAKTISVDVEGEWAPGTTVYAHFFSGGGSGNYRYVKASFDTSSLAIEESGSYGSIVHVWTGSEWVDAVPYVWTGSEWKPCTGYVWTGSAWEMGV